MYNKTKATSYILGVYLGDGHISKNKRTFILQAIDEDFVIKTANSLRKLSDNKVTIGIAKRLTSAKRKVYFVTLSDVKMNKWLLEETIGRKNIPIDFNEWERSHKLEFFSGLLDSEGWVAMCRWHMVNSHEVFDMRIGIGAADTWLYELHKIMLEKGIQVGKITKEKLKSGKIFARFGINKKSFIANGLYFNIKRKQDRIEKYKSLFPGSTTIRGIPRTKENKEKVSVFAKKRKRDSNGRFVNGK